LTAQRAARLDNLDALVSATQTSATALAQYNALLQKLSEAGIYRFKIFDVSGTYSWVPPVDNIIVSACSGGGGKSYNYNGGGSAALVKIPIKVIAGQPINFTVGACGNSATNSTSGGTDGGQTSVLGFDIPSGKAAISGTSISAPGRWSTNINAGSYRSDSSLNSDYINLNIPAFPVNGYKADGTPGGTIQPRFQTNSTNNYLFYLLINNIGSCALDGLGVNKNAGRGGVSTAIPAGDGLVMLEWWGPAS
jgi:hypothetical protein